MELVAHLVPESPTPGPGRAPLTRVEVQVPEPTPAQDWCRHEVRRLVAGRLVGTAIVTAVTVVPLALWQGADNVGAVAFGALAGIVVTGGRVAAVLGFGSFGWRFVRSFVDAPPEFVQARDPSPEFAPDLRSLTDVWDLDAMDVLVPRSPVPATTGRARADDVVERSAAAIETARALGELGLTRVAAVRTRRRPTAMVDLFSDGGLVVGAIDRASGNLSLLTELVGFRVLVTGALLVPPTDDLVVNVVADDAPSALVVSHRRLVQAAVSSRARAGDPVALFKLAQQRETEAYRELGPFWGAMLDRRCRAGAARVSAAPSAADVLLATGNRLFQQTT